MAIDNRSDYIQYQDRRSRSIKKAKRNKIELRQGYAEINPFWNEVLIPNLLIKHGVNPVHSLNEIELLASRFPNHIKQHTIYLDEAIVAGCTMFLNKTVAHAQYIASTKIGRAMGCLDYLFDALINKEYSAFSYFDFGICNEQGGCLLNMGLVDWKEGFGARTIVHEFYEVSTNSYKCLENYAVL